MELDKASDIRIRLPVRNQTLRTQVYQFLRASIIIGDLKAGELYSEQRLSSMLKVSKTPVREALQQLKQEGVIEYFPNRGVRVKALEDNDIREIFEMRRALESFVVESLTKKDIRETIRQAEALLAIQNELLLSNDSVGWISANFDFHLLLVGATGNSRIADAIEKFAYDIQRTAFDVIISANRMPTAFEDHKRLVDALKERDAKAAREIVIQHLLEAERLWLDLHAERGMKSSNSDKKPGRDH